jgi:hypothetical protein
MIIGFHHEDFLCTVETQMYIIFSGPTSVSRCYFMV